MCFIKMGGLDGRAYQPLGQGMYSTRKIPNTFYNQTVSPTEQGDNIMNAYSDAAIGGLVSTATAGVLGLGEPSSYTDIAKSFVKNLATQGSNSNRPTPEQHYGKNTASARFNQMNLNRGSIRR